MSQPTNSHNLYCQYSTLYVSANKQSQSVLSIQYSVCLSQQTVTICTINTVFCMSQPTNSHNLYCQYSILYVSANKQSQFVMSIQYSVCLSQQTAKICTVNTV